ncbi:MAG: hypothetical protein ACYTCN_05520 [Planctomycetota bacterium]
MKFLGEGSTALEDEGELIWPIKVVRRQIIAHVGDRKDYESAFITCEGTCSSDGVTWTMHACLSHASYECQSCGTVRRWGFDRWRL